MADNTNHSRQSSKVALKISLVAILTAVVVVFTMVPKIATPVVKGYISLCDVVICFAAFLFGPWVAAIAGGLGSALADLLGGYAQWAPFSLIVHGLQGMIMGCIALPTKKKNQTTLNTPVWRMALAGVVGMVVMVAGYYLTASLFYGFEPALVEVPLNLLQSGVGVIIGIIVAKSTVLAYPPVLSFMR
ncbi:MAG: ECF transporter S component [Sphaerochaetaceae bacterium]|jgi:uncharacterized membrane protein|nr:ECF transporter S component [Sphaerochaetaceae bacterium]NLO61219.1 ECF transporter S component [Spirochaetales bacterium]MDD2404935.1 ECF transporter S component [Sphaerochaetaceae bacterium]MDD4258325.1 ECF transporter S component [Sphaerochaetaceae bacterium]MDD4762678.1 ECF transporter S component [Sphaerochaetaceae bacterium]